MHKLSRVEAERVSAVLDETIAKLRLVRCVPKEPVPPALDDLSRSGGRQLAASVDAVWQLEAEKSSWLVQQKHEDEMRTLVRSMQLDPSAAKVLASYSGVNAAALDVLLDQLQRLRATTLAKLSTTVEDELATHDRTRELRTSEALLSSDRRLLTRQLVEARALRERDVAELDAKISKLKKAKGERALIVDSSFSTLEKGTKESRAAMEEEHKKQKVTLGEVETKKEESLDATRSELEGKAKVHFKKKNQSVNHLLQVVARFDSDVSTKYSELETLRGEYEREKERFAVLQVHFDKIDEEKGRAVYEDELIGDELLLRAYADKLVAECATGLQKVRRAKMGRVVAAKAAKKGGKKGKK